jgi:hypothetical protein
MMRGGGEHMAEQSATDMTNRNNENLSHIMGRHARKNEEIARQLSREAMNQWQKAINGVLALPAAIALGTAANTLFIAAFIERGFEAFQASAEAMGRELESQVRGIGRSGNGEWAANRAPEGVRPQS